MDEASGKQVTRDRHATGSGAIVSVIVPCYNAVETLSATLDSLRSQTLADWEAICVDDGSTDRTPELLETAAAEDPRVRRIRGEHRGPGAARNAGLEAASARHMVFLDADDIAYPDALALLSDASLNAGDHTIITAGYELLTEAGKALSIPRFPTAPDFSVDALLRGNRLPPMTMVPRPLLPDRPFDESGSLRGCEDWDLWLQLAQSGAACLTLPRVLFGYRLHSKSLSHDADRMYAASLGILDKWMPLAQTPEGLRDTRHVMACNCGALSLAGGSEGAMGRYFEPLPPLDPTDCFFAAVASGVRDAFQFVHGAAGETWADHSAEWLERIETWIEDGPLAPCAEAILDRLRGFSSNPEDDASAVQRLMRDRPDARRLVVYGLGSNGLTLLHHLGRQQSIDLAIADDQASPLAVQTLGLPVDDPRRWDHWPGDTVVVITPHDFEAMRRRLLDAGGREGTDFITLNGHRMAARRTSRSAAGFPGEPGRGPSL